MKIDRNGAFHGEDGKYISKNGLFKISLTFFSMDFSAKTDREIRKSIKSFKRRIAEHMEKIDRCAELYPEWNSHTKEHQESDIRSWKREIRNFK